MTAVWRVLLAWCGLLAVVSCGPQGAEAHPQVRCGSPEDRYVCAQAGDLIYRGRTLRLTGATLYPDVALGGRVLRGTAWASGAAEFRAYIDHWLDLARDDGLNTIRPTDYLAGATDWHDATMWRNLDYVVSGAEARHMFVIVDLSAYRDLLRRSGRFAYDPAIWAPLLDFVGSRYASSSAIAYYSIAGEIEPPSGNDARRATSDQYVAFFRKAIARLHSADRGNHLVSPGGLSHLDVSSGVPWQLLFALPGANVAALHVYSDMDRLQSLQAVAEWAAGRQPLVVEEFGFRQDLGDGARAAVFTGLYALGRSKGAAGMVFWNLGPELRPNSYDVGPGTPAVWAAVARSGFGG